MVSSDPSPSEKLTEVVKKYIPVLGAVKVLEKKAKAGSLCSEKSITAEVPKVDKSLVVEDEYAENAIAAE